MVKKMYYRYLQYLLIFSIVIVAAYIVLKYMAPAIVSVNMPILIVVFLLVTAVSHYVVARSDAERMNSKLDTSKSQEERTKEIVAIERRFINRYMLITTVKLLSFLIALVVYAYLNRADAVCFSLNFIALYLLYSFFEIIYLKKPVSRKE